MKKGIHPDNYRPVVFKDMSNEDVFITRSTINAKETIFLLKYQAFPLMLRKPAMLNLHLLLSSF